MLLKFSELPITTLPHFYGGEGEMRAHMHVDERNRILRGTLAPGHSIGLHTHEAGSEMIFILSGAGTALCDDGRETLGPGDCHYCPKGHAHSLINDGAEDLVFFAVVPAQ